MSTNHIPEEQHNIEIHNNLKCWQNKPILQKIYLEFYKIIASNINYNLAGKIVELGSGIGNLKMLVSNVICTDIFQNPWIDQVENAYHLSFENESVSHIILFDVFHHLQYPGTALNEFSRVLKKNGRVIIFEPSVSLLGLLVYGLFHHEPLGMGKKISWFSDADSELHKEIYYAAQGNASRIFSSKKYKSLLKDWKVVNIKKITSISYVLSGGYGKKQLYPDLFLPFIKNIDKLLSFCPSLFSTRLLVVLEKNKY